MIWCVFTNPRGVRVTDQRLYPTTHNQFISILIENLSNDNQFVESPGTLIY